MLVLGHMATAAAVCRVAKNDVDLRLVFFLTLVADIVDKPLGLVVFKESINNGRVWFHSLAVNLLISFVLLASRKHIVYVLALWMHQLGDRMWQRPFVAFWPWTTEALRQIPLDDWVYYSVLSPFNVGTELAALVAVAVAMSYFRINRWSRFKQWLIDGRLPLRDTTSSTGVDP